MPLVRIDLVQGRTDAELKQLADTVQERLEEVFAAPARDRHQVITEHRPGPLVLQDTGLGIERSDRRVLSGTCTWFDTARPRQVEVLVRRSVDRATGAISVGAFVGEDLVGVSHLLPIATAGGEVAVAVAHRWQASGVAALLLHLLVTLARRAGVQSLQAEVLTQNVRVLQVFTDLGLPVEPHRDGHDAQVLISLRQDVTGGGPETT